MAATRQEIERWFDEGVKLGATHMIVVCDTYDWVDYPVYVYAEDSVRDREAQIMKESMQKVMEVYVLDSSRRESQLNEHRAFHHE